MRLKQGLWLTLVDEAGEETPVACEVTERRPGRLRLLALVPWQVYPVRFVAARLRLDGSFLGRMQLPHQPLELTLDFPIDEQRQAELDSLPNRLRRQTTS
jgi:hypothetical protein